MVSHSEYMNCQGLNILRLWNMHSGTLRALLAKVSYFLVMLILILPVNLTSTRLDLWIGHRYSSIGYCTFVGRNLVTWKTKRQNCSDKVKCWKRIQGNTPCKVHFVAKAFLGLRMKFVYDKKCLDPLIPIWCNLDYVTQPRRNSNHYTKNRTMVELFQQPKKIFKQLKKDILSSFHIANYSKNSEDKAMID